MLNCPSVLHVNCNIREEFCSTTATQLTLYRVRRRNFRIQENLKFSELLDYNFPTAAGPVTSSLVVLQMSVSVSVRPSSCLSFCLSVCLSLLQLTDEPTSPFFVSLHLCLYPPSVHVSNPLPTVIISSRMSLHLYTHMSVSGRYLIPNSCCLQYFNLRLECTINSFKGQIELYLAFRQFK